MGCLAKGCQFLESLGLSECDEIGDDTLLSLAENCHLLQTLEVAHCSNLTDSGFIVLAKVCFDVRFVQTCVT